MNSTQRIGLAIGAGVLAVGAAVGVGAITAKVAGSQGNVPGTAGDGPGRGGGMGQDRRLDTTELAAALAKKLGVDETAAKTALDQALQAARPSNGNGTHPGGTRYSEMLTTMASSIATELDLDQSTVLGALQEVWIEYGPGPR